MGERDARVRLFLEMVCVGVFSSPFTDPYGTQACFFYLQ